MGRFAHSLGIRHLVCGSCNGCEQEMNALFGLDLDVTRHGWELVASPRHADVITVTAEILAKLALIGHDLTEYSLDTIKMFRDDALSAGFSL